MFLAVLFLCGRCWRNPLLVTAFELGLRSAPAGYRAKLLAALRSSGDAITDATQAVTWLYDVESPPYNIPSFRHWHLRQDPINDSLPEFPEHRNEDDVRTALDDFQNNLFKAAMTKPWPFSFAMKSLLTLACDIHSPFHVTELFSEAFPEGDSNGQKFIVQYKGQHVSLFDVWEEGCGALDGQDVNATVDALLKQYKSEYGTEVDWDAVMQETAKITKESGYSGVTPRGVLQDEYVKKCREVSLKQVARAGFALGSLMNRIAIPAFEDPVLLPKTRPSETIAWMVLCFVLPMAVLTVYQRFFHGK